jgi:hypothetical protein
LVRLKDVTEGDELLSMLVVRRGEHRSRPNGQRPGGHPVTVDQPVHGSILARACQRVALLYREDTEIASVNQHAPDARNRLGRQAPILPIPAPDLSHRWAEPGREHALAAPVEGQAFRTEGQLVGRFDLAPGAAIEQPGIHQNAAGVIGSPPKAWWRRDDHEVVVHGIVRHSPAIAVG